MSHTHTREKNDSAHNILVACILNFSFAIFEIAGGLWTGSTAILSDAVHDFGDSLALGLSLLFAFLGKKTPTEKYTYGYKRLSVIGALINIAVLSIGTVFVCMQAIERLMHPAAVRAEGMFLMAVVGMIVNGISVFRMKGTRRILDKTVMLHLMEDLLGWMAVFVVSIVIYFTDFFLLDPILSLLICVIIGRSIVLNAKSATEIIMQATPDETLCMEMKTRLTAMQGVNRVNTFHVWTLDGEDTVVSLSVTVKEGYDPSVLRVAIKEMLVEKGVTESTVEVA